MEKGTVKLYCKENGWGVITPDHDGKDLFVHHSQVLRKRPKGLKEGEKVVFEPQFGTIGLEAMNIKVLKL